jgi:spore coat polysaccharide biosynthesis protein SpsF (cytidylyltransferase family)
MVIEKKKGHKIVLTIEARMASTRLPGKVLKPLAGEPLLKQLISRVRQAKRVDAIILATTTRKNDDALVSLAKYLGIDYFRGSEEDVLSRLAGAVNQSEADVVVGLTGDNPLVDPGLIDDMIDFYYKGNYDYVSNTYMQHSNLWDAERTFPLGVGVQVCKASALLEIDREVTEIGIREHATFAIYHRNDKRYKLGAFEAVGKYKEWNHPELRLTVDTPEDYKLISKIFDDLYPEDQLFPTLDAIRLIVNDTSLKSINSRVEQKIVYKETPA